MSRRSGPRPGARQRGNTATYDARSRLPYRTTLTFPPAQWAWLQSQATALNIKVNRLLVDMARRMQLDAHGRPMWASDADTEKHLADALQDFAAVRGRPERPTVAFPPSVGAKLIGAAVTLDVAVAEVMRGEVRNLMSGGAAGPDITHGHIPQQMPLPVRWELSA